MKLQKLTRVMSMGLSAVLAAGMLSGFGMTVHAAEANENGYEENVDDVNDEEPAAEEPADEEPVEAEPEDEEPAAEESEDEQPTAEEPEDEEPVEAEPEDKESEDEQPAAEEPADKTDDDATTETPADGTEDKTADNLTSVAPEVTQVPAPEAVSVPAPDTYTYAVDDDTRYIPVHYVGDAHCSLEYENSVCEAGELLNDYPDVTTEDGYGFSGWYLDPNGNCSWSVADGYVNDELTLYAVCYKLPTLTQASKPQTQNNNSNDNSNNDTDDDYSYCDQNGHDFELVVLQEPTETTDGVLGLVCKNCNYVAATYVIPSSEAVIRDRYQQIDQAQPGQTVRLTMGNMNSFSRAFMMKIASKNSTNFLIDYTYNNVKYETVIPAGTVVDTSLDWYGPVKMAQLYTTTVVG